MARRMPGVQSVKDESDKESEASDVPNAPMQGGTPGVSAVTSGAPHHLALSLQAPDPEELAKLPKPKLYKVVNGGRVVQGGVPTLLRPGARVNEASHDLAMLKQQGIVLEEILSP